MRIAVCRPQVPFVYGGAEVMADQLAAELRVRGHEAETVTVPYKWYPGTRVLDQAFLWRLLDLEEADGRPIDRVIATKFPAYCVRHPNKVAWIAHQFRQAYDYDRTEFGQFSESPEDRATRLAVERLDRVALGEARRVFAISRNVVDRLKRYTDVDADLPAAAAAEARLPHGRARALRPLGQPARPREADRPADRGGEARLSPPDRRHRRRPRPRAARAPRLGAERAGRVRRAGSTTSGSPTSTRAASPSSTRRSTRTTGWCRSRRSSPRSRS